MHGCYDPAVPDRLTSRQVEAFRAVMLRGSVSGAAEMLGLSQPAVSRLLRDMQDTLGLRLLERRGNGIAPNPEANLLFEEVQQSFISLARIERTAHEIRRAWRGKLRVAAMAGPAQGFLPVLAARFLRDHPDTFVAIHNHVASTTLERVALRQFDFGIAYAPPDYPGLEIEPLPRLEAVLAVPAGDPLASRDAVGPEDLRDRNLLSLGARSGIAVTLEAMLRVGGIMAPVVAEATASETLCRMVGQGAGIALIDPFTAAASRDPAVVMRRFRPRVSYTVALVFPSGLPRSRPVAILADLVRQEARMERLFGDWPA